MCWRGDYFKREFVEGVSPLVIPDIAATYHAATVEVWSRMNNP